MDFSEGVSILYTAQISPIAPRFTHYTAPARLRLIISRVHARAFSFISLFEMPDMPAIPLILHYEGKGKYISDTYIPIHIPPPYIRLICIPPMYISLYISFYILSNIPYLYRLSLIHI